MLKRHSKKKPQRSKRHWLKRHRSKWHILIKCKKVTGQNVTGKIPVRNNVTHY